MSSRFRQTHLLPALAALAMALTSCAPAAPAPTTPPSGQATPAPARPTEAPAARPTEVPTARPVDKAEAKPTAGFDTKAVADFYRGKTVRVVVGYPAGGGFDVYGRAIATHLSKHIPGNPNVVVENQPGAASLVAANQVYKTAQPDGLTMVVLNQQQVVNQLIGAPGIEFDARKFAWVGAAQSRTISCVARSDTGLRTFSDLLQADKPLIVGGTAPGSELDDTPKVLRATTGARFKLVSGYQGSRPVKLAVDSKEVDGMCVSWASLKAEAADWLEQKVANVLVQVSLSGKHPDLKDVPLADEFVRDDRSRQVLRAFAGPLDIGTPFAAPPNTPPDRLAALRQAFLAVFKDPAFEADAKKAQLDVAPRSGERVLEVVNQILDTPQDIARDLAAALSSKE